MRAAIGQLGVAAIVLACAAAQAEAAPIAITPANVSQTFSFNATGVSGPSGTPVSASFSALVQSYGFNAGLNRTELGLNVTLQNTTAPSFDSSLRGYGFNSTPDVSGGVSVSTIFDTVSPGGGGVVETCVADTAENNCTGLTGNGLESGQQSTHLLTLFFSGNQSSISLGALDGNDHNQAQTGFYFRFMAVEDPAGQRADAAKIWGSPTGFGQDSQTATPTPEPSSLVLLGSALGLAASKLRKRRATA